MKRNQKIWIGCVIVMAVATIIYARISVALWGIPMNDTESFLRSIPIVVPCAFILAGAHLLIRSSVPTKKKVKDLSKT